MFYACVCVRVCVCVRIFCIQQIENLNIKRSGIKHNCVIKNRGDYHLFAFAIYIGIICKESKITKLKMYSQREREYTHVK